ncbi:type-1 angiotensin II receptor-associated protein isoform X2 [Poecile atricapillus]|uniref:type-1 angiotensin II receptor-associated protein isoform X2 n=1 Tax=Poecile atricapillus TaxID=48891 RepID=UPI0027397FB5|nr:type-1 angiotensin II receptor-associated protein isoform X2 [Poecile atricapillus]
MELPAVSLKGTVGPGGFTGSEKSCVLWQDQFTEFWKKPSGYHSGTLAAHSVFLTGLLLTVLTDIIHISIFYPSHDFLSDVKRFSIGMAIFSLLLKPVSCYLVYRMYRERGGEYTFNIGVTSAGQDRSTYEPIDQPDVPPQWPSPGKAAQPPY